MAQKTAKKDEVPQYLKPDELVAWISKELKLEDDALIVGKSIARKRRPRATTGLLALDVALNGGFAMNQWTEIIGNESSGKTLTTLQFVATQQQLNPDWVCLWVAAEGFEEEFARLVGVDDARLVIADLNSMEEAFDIVIAALETRSVDCVVIDSFPALVPTGEYEDMMGDMTVGLGARIFNKFFRKVQRASRRSLVEPDRDWVGIIINQWRDQVGGWAPHGGTPKTTPGGKGKNYSFYGRLEISRDEYLKTGTGKTANTFGQTVAVSVLKNKSGKPKMRMTYDFYFEDEGEFRAGDIDYVKDTTLTAELLGILERQGNGNSWYFLGEKIAPNRPAMEKAVARDSELYESVQREVYAEIDRKSAGNTKHVDPEDSVVAKKAAAKKTTSTRKVTRS